MQKDRKLFTNKNQDLGCRKVKFVSFEGSDGHVLGKNVPELPSPISFVDK